ncbi:hypothetical protein BH92_01900 [Rhodococcoides fascians A21d2]|uniref:DUF6924 domain-containing protein n=1 Tax=Rhodococcoides fascians TaxID=1828 RepID=UPI00069136B3|nr:hypothetical protein [Rhodococcus fascians]QIH98781.1 hypothetical protein BH92_01900 [Rhodococcus fascians A21d2]
MSPNLPPAQSILVRTDFTDDSAWRTLMQDAPAVLTTVDDREFAGWTVEMLLGLDVDSGYLFVADARTFADPERTILVLNADPAEDDESEEANSFRVAPEHLASVERNLSIANLDFADFADHTDADGVFREPSSQPDERALTIEELLAAAPGSQLPEPILTSFINDLEGARGQRTTTATYVVDLRTSADYLEANREGYGLSKVVGFEETIARTRQGGSALLFSFPVRSGHWSAWVDPNSLVPIALLGVRKRTTDR